MNSENDNLYTGRDELDEPRIRALFEHEKSDELVSLLDVHLHESGSNPTQRQIEFGIEALLIMIRCLRRVSTEAPPPDTLQALLYWAESFSAADDFKKAVLFKTRQLMDIYRSQVTDDTPIVHRAKAYLDTHYHEDITLSTLAGVMGVSSSYLSRLFRHKTGITFTRYLNLCRMNQAKGLLVKTNLNIYLIAEKVGYDSQYYFSRLFKTMTGFTPMEYRNRHFEGTEHIWTDPFPDPPDPSSMTEVGEKEEDS